MTVEQKRWGIIYCPKEGVRHSHKHWENIRMYLEEKEITYDFVQSQGKDSVERLATMLVTNGYQILIIVGGDSALYRALNGILSLNPATRSQVTLGVIPYGWGNDFARFWGFDEDNYKQSINWIIARRIRKVDVGYCAFKAEKKEHIRYFLNCINVGLVSNIMNIKHKTRRFWGLQTLSFMSSVFLLLFQRMESKMHFKINQDEIHRRIMTVCVSSARGYGQTPNGVPYNGLLDVSVVSHPEMAQLFEGLWMLIWGRFLNHKNVKAFRTRKVQFVDHGKASVSLDGELYREATNSFEVGIIPEWIDFIIPS